ncbi:hypothetical protein J1N35_023733 [Gossypium stocksii]|uniref:Endonuclease/exonuclease/phosphatase domain-containing protein n=1 Tax=Gossypium stocksii TaxID=47602 RepID=A0A9D3VKJ4_9ROSI|nr:hypothetical protein J1N35_023733 [Gossypium stocksii]
MDTKFLVWNCQGCAHRYLREYMREFSLNMIALLETRVSGLKADWVVRKTRFEYSHRIEARGYSGGIWLLWNEPFVVDIVSNNIQFLHVEIKDMGLLDSFFLMMVYGSPRQHFRRGLREQLGDS